MSNQMLNQVDFRDFVEKVRSASNIVEIARSYMQLKQKGQDFWACCPFHSEKTPSFKISAISQMYYCFGCKASGNVFSLVMKMEGLTWFESLELLAKKANMQIPKFSNGEEWEKNRIKKDKMLGALSAARDFYCKNLYNTKNKKALDYLHNRGIDDELIKLFHIGYSDSWSGVVDELRSKGFTDSQMKEAGIVSSGENKRVWDAQFERITFSIHDVYGNCIGFTGRTMSGDENIAKYKNTAETLVFKKSNIVYGIDVMKDKIRGERVDGLIVVEGNVDEISMIKNGFHNTVACMGTALTKFHAGIFARFGKTVYLCLDGDNAGELAALKSIDVLEDSGLSVRVVVLPDKQDPDDFLQKNGTEALKSLITTSRGSIDYKLYYIQKKSNLDDNLGKSKYLAECVDILSKIESSGERELYISKIAGNINVSVESVREDINNKLAEKNKNNKEEKKQEPVVKIFKPTLPVTSASSKAERFIIAAFLHGRPCAKLPIPRMNNKLYDRILQEKLKLSSVYDILNKEELEELRPLIEYQFEESDEEQSIKWNDCIDCLRLEELRIKKANSKDIVEINELQKEIQKIKEKKNAR